MPSSQPNHNRPAVARALRATREVRRADRLAELGRLDEALRSLEQALVLGADRYTCFLKMARLYKSRQQWDLAVGAAESAIEEHPDKVTAHEALIALYMESRDYQSAVAASRELLKLWPRHVPARDALGAAYMGLGDVTAAMRVANELIRVDPNGAAHHFTKAVLCQHVGEVGAAVDEFERVLTMSDDPDLLDSARAHLDAIDAYQLEAILTLAAEDGVFRGKLLRDAVAAALERGFTLSEAGLARLAEIATDVLPDMPPPCKPTLYQ